MRRAWRIVLTTAVMTGGHVAAYLQASQPAATTAATTSPATTPASAPAVDLRAELGEELAGGRIVALRGGSEVVIVDLDTGQTKTIATFGKAANSAGVSWPRWSPDGRQVAVAHDGKAYLINADGSGQTQVLTHEPAVFDPHFWRDPHSGELCIVYATAEGNVRWPDSRGKGQTKMYRTKTGRTQRLVDFPCDGGLSPDGRFLAEGYVNILLFDLSTDTTHVLYGGKQGCCASISPDATHRIMHLYLPHNWFGIRDAADTELWKLDVPPGADEWQEPRWSNHPNFCVAVARYGSPTSWRLTVVRISDKKTLVLNEYGEGWSTPGLWLPAAAGAALPGPIDDLPLTRLAGYKVRLALASDYAPIVLELQARDDDEARLIVKTLLDQATERLAAAGRTENALEAEAAYKDIAAKYAGLAPGSQARDALASPALKAELAAAPKINRLVLLASRLRRAGAAARFDDAAYFARNRAMLVPMVALAAELQRDHAGTRAAARAARIARQYALPQRTDVTANERLEILATIAQASEVPSYESIAPYGDVLTCIRYKVDKVLAGQYEKAEIIVWHWGMRDKQITPAAEWETGSQQKLTIDLFDAHPELEGFMKASDADDPALVPFWALETSKP